jgi:glycerophosphoryl diester phosphodiesterase
MVIHDPTLDRTTNGKGAVRDRTVAELKALRLEDRAGAVTDETVPTLDEVVAVASQAGRRMLLEIKTDASRARYPGIEEKVLALLDRHRMAGSTVVMAFEPATWKRMRELEALRAAGVGFVGLEHTVVDTAALAQARQAGIQVGAWTVNDAAAMKRLIDVGVGVLITDRPDVAKALLGR